MAAPPMDGSGKPSAAHTSPSSPRGSSSADGRVQRPQRVDVVDAGEDAAVARRDHRRDVDRGDPAEQVSPVRASRGPSGPAAPPSPTPRRVAPTRVARGPATGASARSTPPRERAPPVILEDETDGVHRQRRPQRHDGLELVAAGLPFDLGREVPEQIVVGRGVGQDRPARCSGNRGPGTRESRFPGRRVRSRSRGRPGSSAPPPTRATHRRHRSVSAAGPCGSAFASSRADPATRGMRCSTSLQPPRHRDLERAVLAEADFESLLRRRPPRRAALRPADADERHLRRFWRCCRIAPNCRSSRACSTLSALGTDRCGGSSSRSASGRT